MYDDCILRFSIGMLFAQILKLFNWSGCCSQDPNLLLEHTRLTYLTLKCAQLNLLGVCPWTALQGLESRLLNYAAELYIVHYTMNNSLAKHRVEIFCVQCYRAAGYHNIDGWTQSLKAQWATLFI